MHNIAIQLVSSNTGKQVTQFCNPFDYTLSQLFMENIQVTHDPACNSKLLLFTALRYKYTGKKKHKDWFFPEHYQNQKAITSTPVSWLLAALNYHLASDEESSF